MKAYEGKYYIKSAFLDKTWEENGFYNFLVIYKATEFHNLREYYFWWRRALQQNLLTHCGLEAYCATLMMKMKGKMISFLFFQVIEHRWNEIDREKPKYSGKKPVPVPLCPPQIPHELTRYRTRACALGGRRLTAWATARPPKRVS
jgi:hypothetical protein